jgi:hypothetical protein
VAGHRLGQHHPELLLPERHGHRPEHEAGRPRVDGRDLVVGHPALELHHVLELEILDHAAQALLLRPHPHDQRAHVCPSAPAKQRERAQQVLVALLPHESRDRDDEVRAVRGRGGNASGGEALHVDARWTDPDPVRGSALEQKRVACALGAGQEEVGGAEDRLAVGARADVPVCADERKRLPGVHREPEPQSRPQPRGLCGEPEAKLGGVDDVGTAQVLLESQVVLAHRARAQGAEAVSWQLPADRLDRHLLELEGACVEEVVRRHQHPHVATAVELLPGPQIPGVDEITAQKDYSHLCDRIRGVQNA